jgi:hypothetical protein
MDISEPILIILIERPKMTLKEKINLLEKLKEERDEIQQKPRWGVKPRWTSNEGYYFFREMKNHLTTSNKTKIENLKRSVLHEST